MKNAILNLILSIAVIAAVLYFIERKKKKQEYFDYVSNLGFGAYWLDKLSFSELETLYKYIHNFTQKGIAIYYGHPLYDKLTALAKKYPALFPNGVKQ